MTPLSELQQKVGALLQLPRRGSRCAWCYWALYDGWRCQNVGCEFHNEDMSDRVIYLSNQEAHILIQQKPHRK